MTNKDLELKLKKIVSVRIKKRMKELGIKASDLAERLGVANAQLYTYTSGKALPRMPMYLKLTSVLELKDQPGYLLGLKLPNASE